MSTQAARPVPKRPEWGWFAWEATVGYIHDEYSPDATLLLETYPSAGIMLWTAILVFGDQREQVTDRFGIALALGDLWRQVADRHQIFKTLEAASRRPDHYNDDQWLDAVTLDVLTRVIGVTSTVFKEDWKLMMFYRPGPIAVERVQARLTAHSQQVMRSGHGPTLRDACRNLFHNATPDYKRYFDKSEGS